MCVALLYIDLRYVQLSIDQIILHKRKSIYMYDIMPTSRVQAFIKLLQKLLYLALIKDISVKSFVVAGN